MYKRQELEQIARFSVVQRYLNQINNALAFPGIFRGAIEAGVQSITDEMCIEAAKAIAALISKDQLHIAPLVPEFLARNPGIKLDLRLSDTPFDLIEGSFDLALRNAALEDSSLKCRKLADDRRMLCASPGYLHQHGMPRHPDELDRHQLIGFRDQSPKELIGREGRSGQFNPRQAGCRLVVDDGLSQKVATLAGAGISMNSLWSVHRELADGSLVRVLPEYAVNDRSSLWLVYPKSNVLTAKVRIFIDFLMDMIGKSPVWDET